MPVRFQPLVTSSTMLSEVVPRGLYVVQRFSARQPAQGRISTRDSHCLVAYRQANHQAQTPPQISKPSRRYKRGPLGLSLYLTLTHPPTPGGGCTPMGAILCACPAHLSTHSMACTCPQHAQYTLAHPHTCPLTHSTQHKGPLVQPHTPGGGCTHMGAILCACPAHLQGLSCKACTACPAHHRHANA